MSWIRVYVICEGQTEVTFIKDLLSAVFTPKEIDLRPCKRLKSHFSAYDKPFHGVLAAQKMGLDKIRQECTLFDQWLKCLESLAPIN